MQVHTVHIAYIYIHIICISIAIYIYVCVRVCGDIIPADTKFEGEGIKVLLLPSGLLALWMSMLCEHISRWEEASMWLGECMPTSLPPHCMFKRFSHCSILSQSQNAWKSSFQPVNSNTIYPYKVNIIDTINIHKHHLYPGNPHSSARWSQVIASSNSSKRNSTAPWRFGNLASSQKFWWNLKLL